MKNIVIIIKNLPDNLVNEGLVGGMKQLEMDIDPKKPMELDWQTSGDIEKARLIEAIVKIQSNYAYTLLRKMPMEQRHRVMAILARDTSEKFFQNNFGNFNLN